MKLLTNLIFEPKGKHDPSLAYSIKDTVMSADGSQVYFALQDVPAGTALTDEDYWKLQIDLSASKFSIDAAIADFANYAKEIGTKVRGETATASGNPATFLPDAGSLLQPVTVLEPQQEGSGDPYPAGGGKNLLPNNATTKTINGVTFTVNADGSLTMNGTATSDADFPIFGSGWSDISNKIDLDASETYILSDRTDGAIVYIRDAINDVNIATYSGYNATFTDVPGITYAYIQVQAGTTVNNETIHPMIRLASDPDDSYAPHSNIRPFIGYDKLDLNAAGKNLLPNNAVSVTKNGLTFTVNNDGSVTVNGTCDSNSFFTICESVELPKGVYVINGNPAGYNYSQVRMYVDKHDSTAAENHEFSLATAETIKVNIVVYAGVVLNNAVFKPMIRLASDTNATYEPYTGKLHTVQIGQTVYGGKFDWLTGKLVAEWVLAKGVFTRATLDSSGKLYAVTGIPSTAKPYPTTQEGLYEPYIVCTALLFKTLEAARRHGKPCITQYGTEIYIGGYIGKEAELDALLASDDFAVAYKLATPIEIQLTPHVLTAVEPEQNNTLYGDGTIEVEYVKPLHVSIEERVAAALAAAAE